MRTSVLLCFCLFAVTPSVLAKPDRQQGKCGALKYKVAATYVRTNDLAAMAISINPKDVTVRNLLTLACQLRWDYSDETEVSVNIFNDERAARVTDVPSEIAVEISKGSNPDAYVASYRLDRQTGLENLTLIVDPDHICGQNIQIDLRESAVSTVSIVSCK